MGQEAGCDNMQMGNIGINIALDEEQGGACEHCSLPSAKGFASELKNLRTHELTSFPASQPPAFYLLPLTFSH